MTERSIFRSRALHRHTSGQEKDVLPRIVRPPVFIFLWILLLLLVATGVNAWFSQVPVEVYGAGVIVDPATHVGQVAQKEDESVALLFLPFASNMLTKLRVHESVRLVISSTGIQVIRTIDAIEPRVIGPDDARKQYELSGDLSQLITGPSIVVRVQLGPAFVASAYKGSSVRAAVEIGTRRIISFLPGLENLNGEQ